MKSFQFYIQFDFCDAAEIVVFMCYNIKVIVSYVENFSAAVVKLLSNSPRIIIAFVSVLMHYRKDFTILHFSFLLYLSLSLCLLVSLSPRTQNFRRSLLKCK